jgi:hypothetical protein
MTEKKDAAAVVRGSVFYLETYFEIPSSGELAVA